MNPATYCNVRAAQDYKHDFRLLRSVRIQAGSRVSLIESFMSMASGTGREGEAHAKTSAHRQPRQLRRDRTLSLT